MRCSKFLTLALISETICTPLLLEVVVAALLVEFVLATEILRVLIGRGVGGLSLLGVGERRDVVLDSARAPVWTPWGVDI
jgi:hypothetical protein